MKQVMTFCAAIMIAGGAWAADAEQLGQVRAAIEANGPAICRACDLRGANLSAADLSGADFAAADLTNADLSGARLAGANLTEASLIGANLISADLTDADLTGANLSRAFIRATRFCGTVMPDGRRDDSGC